MKPCASNDFRARPKTIENTYKTLAFWIAGFRMRTPATEKHWKQLQNTCVLDPRLLDADRRDRKLLEAVAKHYRFETAACRRRPPQPENLINPCVPAPFVNPTRSPDGPAAGKLYKPMRFEWFPGPTENY